MNKKQVLELLCELLRDAYMSQTAADDPSGLSTKYFIDQEQLMRNIEVALKKEALA